MLALAAAGFFLFRATLTFGPSSSQTSLGTHDIRQLTVVVSRGVRASAFLTIYLTAMLSHS